MDVYKTYEVQAHAVPYDRINRGRVYREQLREIEKNFKQALRQEYLVSMPDSVADKVWEMAWDAGHSAGYYEVESHYQDFAELANVAYAEGFNTGEAGGDLDAR